MRTLLVLVILAFPLAARADDFDNRAAKLQRDAIVIDTHVDAPEQLVDKWADISVRGATDHFDLPRAKEGGLSGLFFSIYVDARYATGGAARRALELIDLTHRVAADHLADTTLATSVAEI